MIPPMEKMPPNTFNVFTVSFVGIDGLLLIPILPNPRPRPRIIPMKMTIPAKIPSPDNPLKSPSNGLFPIGGNIYFSEGLVSHDLYDFVSPALTHNA